MTNVAHDQQTIVLTVTQDDIDMGIANRNKPDDYGSVYDCPVGCAMRRLFKEAGGYGPITGIRYCTVEVPYGTVCFVYPPSLEKAISSFDAGDGMIPGEYTLIRQKGESDTQ